jgi:hypothetical protein
MEDFAGAVKGAGMIPEGSLPIGEGRVFRGKTFQCNLGQLLYGCEVTFCRQTVTANSGVNVCSQLESMALSF